MENQSAMIEMAMQRGNGITGGRRRGQHHCTAGRRAAWRQLVNRNGAHDAGAGAVGGECGLEEHQRGVCAGRGGDDHLRRRIRQGEYAPVVMGQLIAGEDLGGAFILPSGRVLPKKARIDGLAGRQRDFAFADLPAIDLQPQLAFFDGPAVVVHAYRHSSAGGVTLCRHDPDIAGWQRHLPDGHLQAKVAGGQLALPLGTLQVADDHQLPAGEPIDGEP